VADTLLGNAPIPLRDPVVDANRMLSQAWMKYLVRLPATLYAIPSRLNGETEIAQAASIAATDISGAGLLAGLYRVSYYARVTQAATTSSSLVVTLGWTDGGVAQSYSGADMTGNTTATNQAGSVLIRVDAGQPVTYATTYGSVGGTVMQYAISVTLEKVLA